MYITFESINIISDFLNKKIEKKLEDTKYISEDNFRKEIYTTEEWSDFSSNEDYEYSLELEEVIDKLEVYYYWFIKITEDGNTFTIAKC